MSAVFTCVALALFCNAEQPEMVDVEEEKTLVMDVDPLDHPGSGDTSNSDIPATQCLDDTILPVLPRSPSMEEQKQKFMMYHLATDPSNFMRYIYPNVLDQNCYNSIS